MNPTLPNWLATTIMLVLLAIPLILIALVLWPGIKWDDGTE